MPRARGKAKQTRLTFAPVSSTVDEAPSNDKSPRPANMRYNPPSAPSIRPRRSSHQDDISGSPHANKSPKREEEPLAISSQDEADTKPKKKSRKRKSPSPLEDKDSESDADDIITKPRRKLRQGKAPKPTIVLYDDSDEDDVIISSPAKRRRRNNDAETPQTPRQDMEQDELDIQEDLADLQDSVVKESRTRGRPIDSARAKRQQHLEALRRRRAGDKKEDVAESESEDEEAGSEDSESDNNPTDKPLHTARMRNQELDSDIESAVASNEDLDKSDDEFVLADDDAELGAPTGTDEIPLEFTRHAYKQTKEYFQDAIEWMVHNQLNPAFPRTSARFNFAFAKVDDEVRGRAGSQLVSSSWNVAFRRALMARPHIEVTYFPAMVEHSCDACNRSNHPASSDMKLYGKAYSLETLEPLIDEESEGEQSDYERERDREGNILPDEGTRFLLGKHCKEMATMAHTLIHWRFHLNEWVVDYLDHKGILNDEDILERSHWSQRRKTKFANETLEMMIETGEIQKLWRDFHINLKTVRETTSRG
ncbi:hypothetical protein PHISCL_03743 [Aspergillus sclerotialis]|uniref:DUF4211 domain-containing protein n=1 Tax=Aspergillus sclerotialis TaxID=2070753 RepID=A0A3A2ZR52_9EURO|nr:hypothetical protein PHISCL_03743 [Aspergillus sclerotialis]